jgi:hypothetical protein
VKKHREAFQLFSGVTDLAENRLKCFGKRPHIKVGHEKVWMFSGAKRFGGTGY